MLEQFKGRRVQPLQIVEKQRERVLRPGERAEKPLEHHLEAILRVLRRDLRDGRLFADHQLEVGNQIYHQLTIRTHSLPDRIPPLADFLLALTQGLAHKALEGLRQGSVRYNPLVLVELPRNENPARRHDRLVQLVYYRGLADARVTQYEDQFSYAANDDAIEGSQQRLNLALPAVKLLRDQQPVRYIVSAKREQIDVAVRLPFL